MSMAPRFEQAQDFRSKGARTAFPDAIPRWSPPRETVNRAPYADGWMLKLKPADANAFNTLLDAAAYGKLVG
jgi:hypothetical protein